MIVCYIYRVRSHPNIDSSICCGPSSLFLASTAALSHPSLGGVTPCLDIVPSRLVNYLCTSHGCFVYRWQMSLGSPQELCRCR